MLINQIKMFLLANKKHYAFIADNLKDPFIKDIYKASKEKGKEKDIYVDASFLDSDNTEYDKSNFLSIAIATRVDGIILVGEQNKKISELIKNAESNKIPVVTILNDYDDENNTSDSITNKNFIGLDNTKLGNEYGNLIIDIVKSNDIKINKSCNVTILSPSLQGKNQSNNIKKSIEETLSKDKKIDISYNINNINLESKAPFSASIAVSKLVKENKTPNIIICHTKEDTLNVYATLIDYNKIGDVKIIGFYYSEELLNAISKHSIYATIKPNIKIIADECIDALIKEADDAKSTIHNIDSFEVIDYNNIDRYYLAP